MLFLILYFENFEIQVNDNNYMCVYIYIYMKCYKRYFEYIKYI